jgi:hypothetical protein
MQYSSMPIEKHIVIKRLLKSCGQTTLLCKIRLQLPHRQQARESTKAPSPVKTCNEVWIQPPARNRYAVAYLADFCTITNRIFYTPRRQSTQAPRLPYSVLLKKNDVFPKGTIWTIDDVLCSPDDEGAKRLYSFCRSNRQPFLHSAKRRGRSIETRLR